MRSDEARKYFKDCGLKYSSVKGLAAHRLVSLIREELSTNKACMKMIANDVKESDFFFDKNGELIKLYFFVRSDYFNGREAISFNLDGFIGFAGWASSINQEPFITAFIKWCDWLKEKENS